MLPRRRGRPWSARVERRRGRPWPARAEQRRRDERKAERLPLRGLLFALLLLTRLVAAGFGIAAGLALLRRRPDAVTLAKASLVITAIVDVFVYATPYFPTNLLPGDAPFYAAVSVAYSAIWIAYLTRSKRVREYAG